MVKKLTPKEKAAMAEKVGVTATAADFSGPPPSAAYRSEAAFAVRRELVNAFHQYANTSPNDLTAMEAFLAEVQEAAYVLRLLES